MRLSTLIQLASAVTIGAMPAVGSAAPVRAASALPTKAPASVARPVRAATPIEQPSQLIGFPILAFAALFGTLTVIAVVASGHGRSPG